MKRFTVSSLTIAQLLAAAHDPETAPLPDVVMIPNRGTACVAWRDPAEPIGLRAAAARTLADRYAPPLDALWKGGFDQLPAPQRRCMTAALRSNPEGVLRLMCELAGRGMALEELLRRSTPPTRHATADWRDSQVWAPRAIATLTRLGFAWHPQRCTLEIDAGALAGLMNGAPERLHTLGQPLAILEASNDTMTFLAVEQAESKGPPLHAHEEVDQLELAASGRLAFTLGTRTVPLRNGQWLPVARGRAHTFATPGNGAVIASVVQGRGTRQLAEFFRMFDGTPAPHSLRGPARASLMDKVYWAFPRFGIRHIGA